MPPSTPFVVDKNYPLGLMKIPPKSGVFEYISG
jgi:hypothetical protein